MNKSVNNDERSANSPQQPAAPDAGPRSGQKFRTAAGFSAIKDGIKARSEPSGGRGPSGRKPPWLRVRVGGGEAYRKVRDTVHEHRLATVCEESHCPNIGECWSNGTATIMLMGSVCTRACRFCSVDTGNPGGWLDADEPAHAAESVAEIGEGIDREFDFLVVVKGLGLEIPGWAHGARKVLINRPLAR